MTSSGLSAVWFEANTDVTVPIDFIVDGDFVTPDSASFVVRGHDGTQLITGAVADGKITIPAASNVITASWENRYISVFFIYAGGTHSLKISYKLSDFLPLSVTPQSVRDLLGVDDRELPDSAIDLTESYFQILDQSGSAISDALTLTGPRNRAVNMAITLQAALNILPSLPLRLMITVREEDSSASRLKEIDFDKLEASLKSALADLLNKARGIAPGVRDNFVFSNPVEIFPN